MAIVRALALAAACLLSSGAASSSPSTLPHLPTAGVSVAGSLRGGGGGSGGGPYTKKIFTPVGMLKDHMTIMLHIPRIFAAYVGPFAIAPSTNEAIMLAVNSKNACPWCTSLHGELGRMAGLGDSRFAINSAASVGDVKKAAGGAVEATFARTFAEYDGRGAVVEAEYEALRTAIGPNKAASVKALCWFLHWGSVCGNTIGAFIKGRLVGRPKCGSSWLSVDPLYELLFTAYYGVCYTLVTATSLLLKAFPAGVPGFVNSLMGVVLTCVASIWIVPLGLLGTATAPLRIFCSKTAKSTY
jgi:AhpD family alkylhydroperoxidase